MTCRKADELMENVLDGDADDESANELKEHLGDCERCADAWHAIWQVRSLLTECEPADPGEAYFRQATASIMDRVSALHSHKAPAEESPIISSMRYGPLPVRGVGAAFVFAVGVLVSSFVSGSGEARSAADPGVRDVGWVPARAFRPPVGDTWAFRGAVGHSDGHNARNGDRHRDPSLTRTASAKPGSLVRDESRFVRWETPPPMIPTPQAAMSR